MESNVESAVCGLWVPGGGITDQGELTDDSRARLEKALDLHQQDERRVLVLSGGLSWLGQFDENQRPEADLMRDILLESGVDDSMIRVEDQAKNTLENVAMSIKAGYFRDIPILGIVTQPYQQARAKFLFSVLDPLLATTPINAESRDPHSNLVELRSKIFARMALFGVEPGDIATAMARNTALIERMSADEGKFTKLLGIAGLTLSRSNLFEQEVA